MLSNFFRLNGTPRQLNATELETHFASSKDLRNAIYQPDKWPQNIKKVDATSFENVSFSKTQIEKVTFKSCTFKDCLFIGTTLQEVEFHSCKFENCNFAKCKIDECYLDPKTLLFNKKYKSEAANVGVHTYHQLLENASKSKQPIFEMVADIKFRQWKRAQLLYDLKQKKIHHVQYVWSFLKSFIYEWVCGFGYRPLNFIVATGILFGSISAINMYALADGLRVDNSIVSSISFSDSIFYTFSAISALSFTNIIPITAFTKILTVIEGLFGIGWFGLFTAILVKRFLK